MTGGFGDERQAEAARSAASFPGMPTWLGIQTNSTRVPAERKFSTERRMSYTTGWGLGLAFVMQVSAACESLKMRMRGESMLLMEKSRADEMA